MTRAVFVDRDGVINQMIATPEGPDSPRSANEFHLLPGAAQGIRILNQLGLPVVLVSNQPGVAKGKFPAANLNAITERMKDELQKQHAVLDGIYYCLHHPRALVAEYQMICDCRKPKPGLLTQAAREMGIELAGSYMVGDQPGDVIAGQTVGCITFLVGSDLVPNNIRAADHVCRDLDAAARLIAELEAAAVVRHDVTREGTEWRSLQTQPT
jgi:D-glycero-D-manno-heptose 1,7-bisphosphate phosphatase